MITKEKHHLSVRSLRAPPAAKDMGEIPFSTVIAAEYFGEGKTKYKYT